MATHYETRTANPAEEAWTDAYTYKAELALREAERQQSHQGINPSLWAKIHHAWTNPKGRASVEISTSDKITLVATGAVIALMVVML